MIIKEALKAGNKKTNPRKFGINAPLSNKCPILVQRTNFQSHSILTQQDPTTRWAGVKTGVISQMLMFTLFLTTSNNSPNLTGY